MAPLPLPNPDETIEISPADLEQLLATHRDAVRLVDCREPDEFAIASIPSATQVPLSTFPDAAEHLLADPDTPLVVYCHHGMRSAHATQYLRSRGIRSTFSLRGGIESWSTEVDPSVPRY